MSFVVPHVQNVDTNAHCRLSLACGPTEQARLLGARPYAVLSRASRPFGTSKWMLQSTCPVSHVTGESGAGCAPACLGHNAGKQADSASHDRGSDRGARQAAAAALDPAPHHISPICHHIRLHSKE